MSKLSYYDVNIQEINTTIVIKLNTNKPPIKIYKTNLTYVHVNDNKLFANKIVFQDDLIGWCSTKYDLQIVPLSK